MKVISFTSGSLPVISMAANPAGEKVNPADILSRVSPFKTSGVRIQLSGHFLLPADLEFDGYQNLQIIGAGSALLEQQHAYNSASPLALKNCSSVHVSDLRLLGSGLPRSDGQAPAQIGMRICRSRYVWVERCEIGSCAGSGTIQHGIYILDDSHFVWVRENHISRTTAAAVMVGSGIWKHPPDQKAFAGHDCNNIHILDNDFDTIATGVAIDDHTALSWITGNHIGEHFASAITIEDGSLWFVVSDNQCGPGSGSAISLRGGQSDKMASRGIIANNAAAGCCNHTLTVPAGFYSEHNAAPAFDTRDAKHVVVSGNMAVQWG